MHSVLQKPALVTDYFGYRHCSLTDAEPSTILFNSSNFSVSEKKLSSVDTCMHFLS